MFTPEVFVYLTVLFVVVGSAVWDYTKTRNDLRLRASLLMLFVWVCVMISQLIESAYNPVAKFAVIDTVTAITFGLIAITYNKLWPWWIATFHAASLIVHGGFIATGETHWYAYGTALTLLSYLSLMWIVPWQSALQSLTEWWTKGAGHAYTLPSFSRVFRFNPLANKG